MSMTSWTAKYMTTPEVAVALGISERTVHRYLKDGRLVGAKVGGRWLILRESAENIVERLAKVSS